MTIKIKVSILFIFTFITYSNGQSNTNMKSTSLKANNPIYHSKENNKIICDFLFSKTEGVNDSKTLYLNHKNNEFLKNKLYGRSKKTTKINKTEYLKGASLEVIKSKVLNN